MEATATKQQLIEHIQRERAKWNALLDEVGEERMSLPGAVNDNWTFKDLVAHLTAWWRHEAVRLDAALRNGEPVSPWPEDIDVDDVNEWTYDTNKDRPVQEVLSDARAVWQQLEDSVQVLSEQDLTEPGRFDWMEGQALGPGVLHDFLAHFHEEHERAIRKWLAGLDAQ